MELIKEEILLGYSKKMFKGELLPSLRMIFFQVFEKVDQKIYAKGTNRLRSNSVAAKFRLICYIKWLLNVS